MRGRRNKEVEIHICRPFCHLPNSDHIIMFLDNMMASQRSPTPSLVLYNPFPTKQLETVSKTAGKKIRYPLLEDL